MVVVKIVTADFEMFWRLSFIDLLNSGSFLNSFSFQGDLLMTWLCLAWLTVSMRCQGCILRRLLRIARHYGSEPMFICCSATIGNPKVDSLSRPMWSTQWTLTSTVNWQWNALIFREHVQMDGGTEEKARDVLYSIWASLYMSVVFAGACEEAYNSGHGSHQWNWSTHWGETCCVLAASS